jgi:hypothetical protein
MSDDQIEDGLMSDDQIEDMVRELIHSHLTEEARIAATCWLEKRMACYLSLVDFGLIDETTLQKFYEQVHGAENAVQR